MPKRRLPTDNELIAMYESGMSTGEISEYCNVKPVTVVSAFHRMGYKLRNTQDAATLKEKRGRSKRVAYWAGKTQPAEMVESRVSKIRGTSHWLWKNGTSRREYRHIVKKVQCAKCGSRTALGIHHGNLDHYDNRPDNLIVLCIKCHMSLHKQAYWDAIHNGSKPPRSNGPVGWR